MKKLAAFIGATKGAVQYLIAQITPTGAIVIGVFGGCVAVSTLIQMCVTSFRFVDMSLGEVLYRYTLAVITIAFYGWRYPIAKMEERKRLAEAHLKDWVEREIAKIEREMEGEVNA